MKKLLAVMLAGVVCCADAECLKDGDTVIIKGKLVQQVFPGPPNYYSIQQGDTPETDWLLVLDRPQCMVARSEETGAVVLLSDRVEALQVAVKGQGAAVEYAPLVGHRVEISGPLYKAQSGHVHAVALIGADAMRKLWP